MYFFDMLCLGVCTTRHWQTSGRLVQGINVCTVALISLFFQGTFLVTQAVAQAMVEAKVQTGSIVNIASIVAKASSKILCPCIYLKNEYLILF